MSTQRPPQVLLQYSISITTTTATVDIVLLSFPRGLPRPQFSMTIDSAHSALAETVVQPLSNSCIENFRRTRPSPAKPHGSIRFRIRFRDILFGVHAMIRSWDVISRIMLETTMLVIKLIGQGWEALVQLARQLYATRHPRRSTWWILTWLSYALGVLDLEIHGGIHPNS